MSALDLQAEYFVNFTGLSESFKVFTYSRATKTFTALLRAAGYAGVMADESTTVFSLLGTEVLSVGSDGSVEAVEVRERAPTTYPRLDFMRKLSEVPDAVASVDAAGHFCARQVIESERLPDGSDRIEFYGKAAINQLGLIATEIIETGS